MSYNSVLAAKIKKEYDFNDYEISKEKLIEVTNIVDALFKYNQSNIEIFLTELHFGKLGMFYKQPVSFLSVANKYYELHCKSNHVVR